MGGGVFSIHNSFVTNPKHSPKQTLISPQNHAKLSNMTNKFLLKKVEIPIRGGGGGSDVWGKFLNNPVIFFLRAYLSFFLSNLIYSIVIGDDFDDGSP